jgi:hypothetical protein
LSCHVDDLKIAAKDAPYARLKSALEKSFGKLTEKCAYESSLEHCGIIYEQLKDYSIKTHQLQYALQLKTADIPAELASAPSTVLTPALLGTYQSLLGGAAWMCQTRPDICIYIQALQRATTVATIGHLQRLNKVVRYIKLRPAALYFAKYDTVDLKILCISDSAYRREDPSCLAMRGSLIARSSNHAERPGGVHHPLEYFSKRQRKVTRSTFAAETMSLADGVEISRVIAQTFTAIQFPKETMSQLVVREETGKMFLPIHAAVDCKSLFDSLSASELRLPSESSLILILAGLKEQLLAHNLKTLWWINTESMLSDGLNKGVISRLALRNFANTGRWEVVGEMKKFSEVTFKAIRPATQTLDESHFAQELQVLISSHDSVVFLTALCDQFYEKTGVPISRYYQFCCCQC